ncbi:Zinc finger, ZZ type family protein [Candida albicans]|uniref:Zinc finger, ZZ type family protein n=1 Tax=Candida albicans TaxID=5476 RepID=A0A8H6F5Y2_CANAX|nr:Zinc finger, ZZ type family protein [Candida albicans]
MPSQNHNREVIIKLSITRTHTPPDSTTTTPITSIEKTICVKRELFTKIKSKPALTEFLNKQLPGYLSNDDNYLVYTRKPPSIDFGNLRDALIDAAYDHFKEIFNEFSNGLKKEMASTTTTTTTTTATTSNTKESPPAPISTPAEPFVEEPKAELKSRLKSNQRLNSKLNSKLNETDSSPIHPNICCDVCHPYDFVPLKGIRYNCLVCSNFDLCSKCEAKQHIEKLQFGPHSYLHPMAKITYPTMTSTRGFGFGYTNHFSRASSNCGFATNDIVYDIPLKNCNADTKRKLEELLKSKGFEGFIKDVEHYISNSERYEKLCAMMDFEEEDEEVKYLILMSALEYANNEFNEEELIASFNQSTAGDNKSKEMTSSESSSAPPPPQESESETETGVLNIEGDVIARPKNFGGNVSQIVSLQLINNTNETIQGGELLFEFFNQEQTIPVKVKNASKLPEEFKKTDANNNVQLRITSPNAVLLGDYKFNTDSMLKLQIIAESKITTTSVVSGSTLQEEDSLVLQPNDEVQVTLVPKSNTLAQAIITNKSHKAIDCNNLKLEIINCFDKPVSSITIHKKHSIMPGKTAKFNFTLINTHTKYPFKFILQNDYNIASCDMNKDDMSGNLVFEENCPMEIDERETSATSSSSSSGTESIVDDNDNDNNKEEMGGTSGEFSSGSIHSIVLPSLPKESFIATSRYFDANSDVTNEQIVKDKEFHTDEDYDIISGAEEEDPVSDFEVLSAVSTNNQ